MSSELFLSGMPEKEVDMVNDPAVYMQCPFCREPVILEYRKYERPPYQVRCHKGRAECGYHTDKYDKPHLPWLEHVAHMDQLHDYHEEQG